MATKLVTGRDQEILDLLKALGLPHENVISFHLCCSHDSLLTAEMNIAIPLENSDSNSVSTTHRFKFRAIEE